MDVLDKYLSIGRKLDKEGNLRFRTDGSIKDASYCLCWDGRTW